MRFRRRRSPKAPGSIEHDPGEPQWIRSDQEVGGLRPAPSARAIEVDALEKRVFDPYDSELQDVPIVDPSWRPPRKIARPNWMHRQIERSTCAECLHFIWRDPQSPWPVWLHGVNEARECPPE